MGNPILDLIRGNSNPAQTNQNGSGITGILQMFHLFRNANNPQEVLNAMAAQNPNVQGAMDLIAQHNGDGQAAFYAKAKEMGVDPEEVLKYLR